MRILLTGGAGSLAGDIIPGLLREGHEIWAVDRVRGTAAEAPAGDGLGALHRVTLPIGASGSPEDARRLRKIAESVQVIVHLAGIPLEDDWDRLLSANIDQTRVIFDLAHQAGVRRVVFASSVHAAGFTPVPEAGDVLPADCPVWPNTLYGSTKAAGEALAKYYVSRFGLEILNVRICSRTEYPTDERMLSTWLSPADATRLFHAGVTQKLPESLWSVWGVSANRRSWFDPTPGEAIGFVPQDDAELYAETIEASVRSSRSTAAEGAEPWRRTIGGAFSSSCPPRMKGHP